MSHTLRMLIGCVLPLLLIFLLPLLGLGEGLILVVFLVLMLGGHLWMMRGHDDAYEHRPGGTGGGICTPRGIENMTRLSIRRLGFALGALFGLLYLGCVFVMATVPKDAAVRFFNSLTTASTGARSCAGTACHSSFEQASASLRR